MIEYNDDLITEDTVILRDLFVRLMLILIVGCGSIGIGLWLVL